MKNYVNNFSKRVKDINLAIINYIVIKFLGKGEWLWIIMFNYSFITTLYYKKIYTLSKGNFEMLFINLTDFLCSLFS